MHSQTSLLQILRCLDLTSLEATDHEKSLLELIHKANNFESNNHVAAVCIFPNWGNFVKTRLDSRIKTAVVAGSFPTGQTMTEVKLTELQILDKSAVDEIDIVLNRGTFLAGDYDNVSNELLALRNAAPSKILKVILETGELKTAEHIQKASQLAIDSGADFIKTSTGKSAQGANIESVTIMCSVIKKHFEKTGKKIGIKPSGGIRSVAQAVEYCNVVQKINGSTWLQPQLFRIGASTLFDEVKQMLSHGSVT